MVSADFPLFSLKEPFLTTMVVPSCIDIAVCVSDYSVVVWGFLQVDS